MKLVFVKVTFGIGEQRKGEDKMVENEASERQIHIGCCPKNCPSSDIETWFGGTEWWTQNSEGIRFGQDLELFCELESHQFALQVMT